jgi:hypothetical protein
LPTQGMSHQDHLEGSERESSAATPTAKELTTKSGEERGTLLTRLEILHNEQADQGISESWSPARLCTAAMGGSDVLRRTPLHGRGSHQRPQDHSQYRGADQPISRTSYHFIT